MDSPEKIPPELRTFLESVYVPEHEYVLVDPANFPHLDLSFYESGRMFLEARGYRFLGDSEDRTVACAKFSPLARIMIRAMVSSDGTVTASLYQLKCRFWWSFFLFFILGRTPKVTDFETEYSDGSFLVTSNASMAAAEERPPLIVPEYLPKNTPIAEVLSLHQQRMKLYQESFPELAPKKIVTLQELRDLQNRQNALKAAYHQQREGIAREQLKELSEQWRNIAFQLQEKVKQSRGSDPGWTG